MQITDNIYLVGSDQFGLSYPLDCNCYLIDGGDEFVLIDTGVGMGVQNIYEHIRSHGFKPESLSKIIITHAHLGHYGGADELRELTGAEVWAPELAAEVMTTLEEPGIKIGFKFNRYPDKFEPRACKPDRTIRDCDSIPVGRLQLSAIQVRGHTVDSTCYFLETDGKRALFTGDTVFYGGKLGLINMETCSMANYREDIHKLGDLGIDLLFPAHGIFVLARGQKHVDRAIFKLSDFIMPETFFETNEFVWDREYLSLMAG